MTTKDNVICKSHVLGYSSYQLLPLNERK